MACQNEMDPKFYKAAAEGNFDVFNNLSSSDLEHLLTPNKNTILHLHITANWQEREKSTDFVEKILDLCPPLLLKRNTKGETPIYMAARSGLFHTVKALIERAKLIHKDDLERGVETPLYMAARSGFFHTVKVLIAKVLQKDSPERGVEEANQMLRMRTNDNDTALHEAVRYNYVGIVKLLTEEEPKLSHSANYAGETPLYLAAERGFREVASEILSRPSPAHDGPNGLTALHAAVIRNDEEITREILDVKGAKLTKEADQQGWTPLHYAAYLGHVSMVDMLLKTDISAAYLKDRDNNRTALHLATGREHIDIVEMLISCCPGCWEVVDKNGRNFIHVAADNRKQEAFHEIIIHNTMLSDLLNEKDNDGNTPLHLFVASSTNLDPPLCFLTTHSRVDKMAFNKKNLNAIDINDQMHSGPIKEYIIEALKNVDAKSAKRNIAYKKVYKKTKRSQNLNEKLREAKGTHLIVATLITTVTFAAGFTLPGGYISDKGDDQGNAILTRKTAFKAFIITDTIAMMLSSSSVFIHLFMAIPWIFKQRNAFIWSFTWAFRLTLVALLAMLVAFMTGLYAVLENSVGLAIFNCVLGSYMLYLCWAIIKVHVWEHKQKQQKHVQGLIARFGVVWQNLQKAGNRTFRT